MKQIIYYLLYLGFIIAASYSFGVALANAQECGPKKLDYPVRDIQLDVKQIIKKLLETKPGPAIVKS